MEQRHSSDGELFAFGESNQVREHVLFVHAHPDDETISTGGTIATLVASGAAVTVVTCTRGERGEVIPAELKHLEGDPLALAEFRSGELAIALNALGVVDHRFLGERSARWADREPRRYSDSGMRWGPTGQAEALDSPSLDSLSSADFGEVAADLATVIDDVRPTAVISYDERGGYGHPDHVRAHEASKRAAEVMGVPFFMVLRHDDQRATSRVDVTPVVGKKADALRAHRTQVTVEGDSFALSSGPSRPIDTVESFARLRGDTPGTVSWAQQGLGVHIFGWLVALILGLVVGGIATVNHQLTVETGSVSLPTGIVISIALIAALLIGSRIVFGGRTVTAFAAVGVLGAIAVLSIAGTGGSVIVPANPAGYALTYGPVLLTLLVLAWPKSGTFSRDRLKARPEPKGKPAP